MTFPVGFSQPNPPTPEEEQPYLADIYGFLAEVGAQLMAEEEQLRQLATSQAPTARGNLT